MGKHVLRVFLLTVALIVMALPALANSSSYQWEMSHEGRNVNGKRNGVLHDMTAGELTNSGEVWQYFNLQGATGPLKVGIEVRKVNTLFDSSVCIAYVTPSAELNDPVSYSKDCGTISDGTYYIVAFKGDMDGRSTAGRGVLETQ